VKKVFSILTAILLLTAALHFSVARHYCGGELAASKISLSGGLASCGMESNEESCPFGPSSDHLKSHCCDDVVSYYSIDNNYTQSQTVVTDSYRVTSFIPEIIIVSSFYTLNRISRFFTDTGPPSYPTCTAVDLTDICVFRI